MMAVNLFIQFSTFIKHFYSDSILIQILGQVWYSMSYTWIGKKMSLEIVLRNFIKVTAPQMCPHLAGES